LKTLEHEAEQDEEIYDKMACWCETNDREKTKSIADAEKRLEHLTTEIEEATANSARLGTEIKNLEKEVAENQAALDKATSIRTKELAEFNAEEKDLLQSISALKSAVIVLSKHNSFLQMPKSHVNGVATALQQAMEKHAVLLNGVLTASQQRAASAFVQAKQNYAPQSGEIFGILKQMKETFEQNLASSQKEEAASQKAYEELKSAKEEQIAAGQEQIDEKTQEFADTNEKNAQAKEDTKDTSASLAADQEFLAMLKEKCSMTDSEWEERQKTRQLEMEACSKALAVLSGDDAHDLFAKTFAPGFVEASTMAFSERRAKASQLLSAMAAKLSRPRLAALAVKVRLDAFTRVKEDIDKMIAELLVEKADEIKHKDFCVEEFNKNELETDKKDREKKDLIAKIEDLEMTIDELKKAIDTLKSEIAEMQVHLKRGGEDREKENQEYQVTISEQRATQKLLKAALSILEGFYGKSDVVLPTDAAMLEENAGQAPPPGFDEYKKNESSGGVMGMMQAIINDAKAMEAEAIRSEEDAQKSYEDFVKETNASIEAKSKDIINKTETKATAEADHVEAKKEKESVMTELEQLSNYNAELHSSCDFILKNFDLRQTARDEEVEALRQAKAILSGAKFEEFLQKM